MAPYRVLVVDDSAFMRAIISDLILQDNQFIIEATAVNGLEAVEAASNYNPDVITMDLEMPLMNGIEALQQIMKQTPTPVIMLSGISEANTRDTIKALQCGAIDFIRKPSNASSDDIHTVGEQLLEKLRTAVLVKRSLMHMLDSKAEHSDISNIVQQMKADKPRKESLKYAAPPQSPEALGKPDSDRKSKLTLPTETSIRMGKKEFKEKESKPVKSRSNLLETKADDAQVAETKDWKKKSAKSFKHIVAIGTSTGGPRALHEVISSLPQDFPAPVLVVQHMPPKFTKSLAQRLDSFSQLAVVEAEAGMSVSAGVVYVAPGGYHMEMVKQSNCYTIRLSSSKSRNGHRPSVDVLFESLVPYQELKRHAVIMTGMGSDGAKGMKQLAESGAASTIAESEETCIVYGMPRVAIEGGAVQTVLPLQQIAPHLANAVISY